ncbi:MAG: hypothetical protein LJE67_07940 [Salaquimonas sp.]|nr:hypothetical protein [Salaquimonas sp.]
MSAIARQVGLETGTVPEKSGFVAQVVWFWLAGFVQIAGYLAVSSLFYVDYDDRLRAEQIRELLKNGKWFDRTIDAIAMPEAYISPWSRLVDLPYFLLARGLEPLVGTDDALQFAQIAVPPLLFLALAVPAVQIMRAISGRSLRVLQLFVASAVMAFAIKEFTFGRIDHHNFQLIAVTAMASGWCMANRRAGGLIAGIAVVLAIAIGLEGLPFITLGLGAFGLFASLGDEASGERLQWTGLALLIGAPFAALALVGPQGMAAVACDSFSAPWLWGVGLTGAVLAGAPWLWRMLVPGRGATASLMRLGIVGIPFLAVAGGLAMAFPACMAGPYAIIDPLSRAVWLARVPQEMSILSYVGHRQNDIAIACVLIAMVLIASLPRALEALRDRRSGVVIACLLGLAGFGLAMMQLRFLMFPAVFAALFVPDLMAGMAQRVERHRIIMIAAVLAPVLGVAGAYLALPPVEVHANALDLMDGDECKGADFSVLDETAPARIMAPMGLSFAILDRQTGHSIAALPFHRTAPGIYRMALAFTAQDGEARRQALAPFDYVAVCERPETAIDLADAPLFDALVRGRGWPGLIAVDGRSEADPAFRLYRIDHSSLR